MFQSDSSCSFAGRALIAGMVFLVSTGNAQQAEPAQVEFRAAPGERVALVARFGSQARVLAVGAVPDAASPIPATLEVTLPAGFEQLLPWTTLTIGTSTGLTELADTGELTQLAHEQAGDVDGGPGWRVSVGIRPLPGGHGAATAALELGRSAEVSFSRTSALSWPGYRDLPAWNASLTAARDLGPCGNGLVPVGDRAGAEGSTVVLAAALCSLTSTYTVDDVVMLGRGGIFGRATQLAEDYVVAEVEHVGAFAEPTPLRFLFGNGEQYAVPDLGGVSYPEGVWGFQRASAEPVFRTHYLFEPDVEGLFIDTSTAQTGGTPLCGDPKTFVDQKLSLDEDGCLRIQLPGEGTCTNDAISIRIAFQTPASYVVVVLPVASSFMTWPWSVASSPVLFPLNTALASANCTAVFDAATNEIVICSTDGAITSFAPGSYMRIQFDPALHSVFTEIQGCIDAYDLGNGPELTTPDPAFEAWVHSDDFCGSLGHRDYDSATSNSCLAETFDSFGQLGIDGPVRSAVLEVHMKGVGGSTDTDNLNFGWNGSEFDWNTRQILLPVLGYQWTPGDEATLCFDLSELPDRYGSPIPHNILERLNTIEDNLHVALTDDTDVDYLVLKVLRCTP